MDDHKDLDVFCHASGCEQLHKKSLGIMRYCQEHYTERHESFYGNGKVFLGGTCNGSSWREELMPLLDEAGVSYFNPVVADWDEAAQRREQEEKRICGYHLYVLTPLTRGFYSTAEVVDSAHRNPGGTIICILHEDKSLARSVIRRMTAQVGPVDRFDDKQLASLEAVARLVVEIGGMWAPDLETVVEIVKSGVKTAMVRTDLESPGGD